MKIGPSKMLAYFMPVLSVKIPKAYAKFQKAFKLSLDAPRMIF